MQFNYISVLNKVILFNLCCQLHRDNVLIYNDTHYYRDTQTHFVFHKKYAVVTNGDHLGKM